MKWIFFYIYLYYIFYNRTFVNLIKILNKYVDLFEENREKLNKEIKQIINIYFLLFKWKNISI